MTCRDVIEFLMEYDSGRLAAAERSLFDAHLAECCDCVAYLATYRRTVELSKAALADPEKAALEAVPPELVEAILAVRPRSTSPDRPASGP